MSHRKPRGKKPLAVSFVLTVAALPACDSSSKPPVTPTVEEAGDASPHRLPIANPPAFLDAGESEPPKAQPEAGPTAELPPAPNGGTVTKNADGTCWWSPPPANCRPGIPCNPPAPHQVACPK